MHIGINSLITQTKDMCTTFIMVKFIKCTSHLLHNGKGGNLSSGAVAGSIFLKVYLVCTRLKNTIFQDFAGFICVFVNICTCICMHVYKYMVTLSALL